MADENTKVQMTEKQKVKEITDRLEAGVSYRITCNNGNQRTLRNP